MEDDDDGDEDVEEQAEAMVTKPSNGLSSVFQPLSDMQHLLTDEVNLNLKSAFVPEINSTLHAKVLEGLNRVNASGTSAHLKNL